MPAVSPNVRWFNPLIIDDSSINRRPEPPARITRGTILAPPGKSMITQRRKRIETEGFFIGSPHEHWLSEAWLHRLHTAPISSSFCSPHNPGHAVPSANQFVTLAAINNALSFNLEYLMYHSILWPVGFESSTTTYLYEF